MIGFYLHRTTGAKKGTEYILPIPFSFPLRAGTGNRPGISEHREIRHWDSYYMIHIEWYRHWWQEKSFLNGTNNQEKLHSDITREVRTPGAVKDDDRSSSWVRQAAAIRKSQIVRFPENLSRKVDTNSVRTLNERSLIMAWIIHYLFEVEVFLYIS